ncbi:bifunctional 5,10-methylenetetrahydrofolate dehydrogenase/5,10-methenyltetrahydrofolate cyclohydrolase [Weissella coleopterorum]|uniref:Bifunctional protein FolD n=1 Tax=Weissella coleopterorum TaxID=2714949 RepID=A0A6G8AZC3_9LACO|nr:bifunctional 5,10-methylenetetrahydrofolate dehydrogenase/5,10-methenyltetrahydrofolate cyclohydrolase [Weissella coleopterorum]QIL50414.1 bifunctional 5,10-methylenetetrahydrofolate dehydrogenase/5,10-methenyltetrahydrofolate cyclohydrolase [Weissella coleopterorum]
MAKIINGKEIAQKVRADVTKKVEKMIAQGITPGLAVIIVGEDPASQIYVRNKERAAAKAGINGQTIQFPTDVSEVVVFNKIQELNQDDSIDAILLQSPVPSQIDEEKMQSAIDPNKDVDGFNPLNIGKLFANRAGYYPVANTPKGIMTLLAETQVELQGKFVVILGRSILVGRPLFALLEAENATVALLHRYTSDELRHRLLQQADVVIAATGVPGLVRGIDLKAGSVVIDVGITRLPDGHLTGDVDFLAAQDTVAAITPVPGGVGPMTIATLLQTTVELAAKHHQMELQEL